MAESYLTTCWNCLGEYDALSAVWCSHDPKNPTKLCPFCFRCFCDATEKFKREFWMSAPQQLKDELATLAKSKDRLGDVLIRMKKITTPQLLEALNEQKKTGKKLGEILTELRLVKPDDIAAALKTQGVSPLTDTAGVAYSATPVWDKSGPNEIVEYILALAARKGASDVQIEPKEDAVSVKYRIDGFYFRVDPLPKSYQDAVQKRLFDVFRFDPARADRPQARRSTTRLAETEYDLVAQTLPTAHGLSATIKLINRSTFLKDFETLGLELDDRIRLIEELRAAFGLVLVTAPVFNGSNTTMYSIMSFLVEAGRDVVSLEAPIRWPVEGARQVEVPLDGITPRMDEALRSVISVRPEVVMISAVPDRATATLASQLASSVLVICELPAQSAVEGVRSFVELGVPAHQVASTLSAVTNQRLVRQICRICREPSEAPADQTLAQLGIDAARAATLKFFRGKGCPTCNKVGLRGRRAIFEVLSGAPEVRAAVLNGMPDADVEAMAVGTGMQTLRERGLQLVTEGVTTFDEFTRLRL